jgi:hypothetical protein
LEQAREQIPHFDSLPLRGKRKRRIKRKRGRRQFHGDG